MLSAIAQKKYQCPVKLLISRLMTRASVDAWLYIDEMFIDSQSVLHEAEVRFVCPQQLVKFANTCFNGNPPHT